MNERRIDLVGGGRIGDPETHMRAFRARTEALRDWYPSNFVGGRYQSIKLWVDERLVGEHARPENRVEIVSALVSLAVSVRDNRPADTGFSRVAARIGWPHLFNSEICVYADPTYVERVDGSSRKPCSRRELPGGDWCEEEPLEGCLLSDLGIAVPPGFVCRGRRIRDYDANADWLFDNVHWSVIEEAGQ